MQELVEKLRSKGLKIATMESCTGGGVSNAITNIEGASEIFNFSAITYSNEYKIKMGVSSDVIDKYSVYSIETAREMARAITKFASSDFGIGITGKLNRKDINNLYGDDNMVFVSIYDNKKDVYHDMKLEAIMSGRRENKELIIDNITKLLLELLEVRG